MPRKRSSRKTQPTQQPPDHFWQEQIRIYGRRVFFIDTGGILSTFERNESVIDFLDSLVGDQLITSTYVLAEAVRRIIKSDFPDRFVGPGGERSSELAVHVLTKWLEAQNVKVICPPEQVFDGATAMLARYKDVGWDLVDAISYVIVCGLEQTRIVSPDGHFRRVGLICYPASAS